MTIESKITDLEKRLKIITCGQTMVLSFDRILNKSLASDVVAELWMIPLHRFSSSDARMFYQVSDYVRYSYGLEDLPDWYHDGDVPGDW